MLLQPDDFLKLLLAMGIGAIIGAERELRDKAAGLRTLMFICGGSALFTIFSIHLGLAYHNDTTRIAAQIVSGIGFLGAGVIMRERGEIHGLTTAAMIWLVAALGMGIGSGEYLYSFLVALVVLLALLVFPTVEHRMNLLAQTRVYSVTFAANSEKLADLTETFHRLGLKAHNERRSKRAGDLTVIWTVSGRPAAHNAMIAALTEDPQIHAFEV